ncbi:MAG: FAD:protein FMN transferase [Ktedonobacterales bacterium]|nr:FAD:protein FMN transferase [Ktedonobacterales bacterium]
METLAISERYARVMGSACSIHVAAPAVEGAAAEAAIAAGFAWLRAAEACLTRFDAASELSALNRAGGTWFAASAMLYAVTEAALAAAHETAGLFDPTLLERLEMLGYAADYRTSVQDGTTARDVPAPPATQLWRGVELDAATQRIRLPEGVRLDFGGIGKGWAADAVLEHCFAAFPNVLIVLGGDMRLRGGPLPGGLWSIAVADPVQTPPDGQEAQLAVLTLGAGGVATSGATEHQWQQGTLTRHHLLDPRTGFPAHIWLGPATAGDVPAMATVLAETAARAEVAAKVALLRGTPDTLPGTAGILLRGDGRAQASTHLTEYLHTHGGGQLWWLR